MRLGIAHVGVEWRIILCIVVEVAYMVASRVIYNDESLSFTEAEILRTPFRLAFAVLLWFLAADLIFARQPDSSSLRRAPAVLGLMLLAASPLLSIEHEHSTIDTAILVAASFPVALYEELFFRGILQTLLVKYIGAIQGTSLTAVCFVAAHAGATTPGTLNFIVIFLAGLIIGLIYFKTNSLLAVVLTHAIYDALVELPFNARVSPEMGAALLLASAALFVSWAKSSD